MIEQGTPSEPRVPGALGLKENGWRRLHPVSPLLRGGLVLIVVISVVLANFRDQLIGLFFAQSFRELPGNGESWGPNSLIDYVVTEGLVLAALGIILAVLLLILFFAWLSWRFLTFRVTGEAVEERSGIVFRQHRRAPIDRIQSVNLQRSLFARLLGMTSVEVSTGGSGGKVALRYLAHGDAVQVREQILRIVSAQRAGIAAQGASDQNLLTSAASSEAAAHQVALDDIPVPAVFAAPGSAPASPARHSYLDDRLEDITDFDVDPLAEAAGTLVRVPIGRLLGSVALSVETLILMTAVLAIVITSTWMSAFLLFALLPVVIIFVSLTIAQINMGFHFVLSKSSDGIRVGAGLTSTTTETIPFGRIHAIEARQPLGWRPFGWWSVRITTAGQSVARGGQNRLQNTVLPVGKIEDVLRVFETILPGASSPERDAVYRDALEGPGLSYLRPQRRSIWVLGFAKSRAGIELETGDDSTLRIRSGAVIRRLIVMPIARAQSVQLRRPPIHRFLGLAMIQADTVLGPIHVIRRGLELADARQFFRELAREVARAQSDESERRMAHHESQTEMPSADEGSAQ